MLTSAAHLLPSDSPHERGAGSGKPFGLNPAGHENLPYHDELWDDGRKSVELVLAATASASIGFAAYYAAIKEFPQRLVTLRHKGAIISSWNNSWQ